MDQKIRLKKVVCRSVLSLALVVAALGCAKKEKPGFSKDAASKVYVAPGSHDEMYAFMSGGFSGQVSVYGIPSGRLFKVIPVFSQNPETGYGYSEETKAMFNTSYGFVPWDDSHHPEFSETGGVPDGRWLFINANNTPRIARIDLRDMETAEILEIPNSAGNHGSPFTTMNSEYVVASTRFSVPIPQKDVPISSYKENFKGTLSFVKVDPKSGHMNVGFQIMVPGFDYDLAHCGKGASRDWAFFTCYNTELAHTNLEINASKNDKDYIAAVNWKLAEKYAAEGKGKVMHTPYYHNYVDPKTRVAVSEKRDAVRVLDPKECPGMIYYLPTPKSPHGVDIDPSGEYIVGNGKLSTVLTIHSFSKMLKAIEAKKFDTVIDGIPVINFNATLAGEVKNPGLGPLHTEFDGKGYAYTSAFISSEIVKWKLGTWQVVDRHATYYAIGHLSIPGGDSAKPWGKYALAINKVAKDRFLPTGPDQPQSAQLFDITGDKMKLLLDFPTIGEPHYAQMIPAEILTRNNMQIYPLESNGNPNGIMMEDDAKVERKGNEIHIKMIATRSHFTPDNIEGVRVGDKVYFHVTNQEQDWDLPHGFAVQGMRNSELLVMPGETRTIVWEPKAPGVYPFYCTDFCSALHQEMQGYIRVSAAGSKVPISYGTGK